MWRNKDKYQNVQNPVSKAFFSLGTKIILLVSGTAFFTAFLIGGFFYTQTSQNALQIQTNELAAETSLIAPVFQAAFSELRKDVFVLSETPPIAGLIRTADNNGIDSVDGSTDELWRKRLGKIFELMIRAKDSYVQIRYIGIADGGRELVRVNKHGSFVEFVPAGRLQQKQDEFYFKEALNVPKGDIYYSVVSLNRENGKVQKPFLPIIRVAKVIYDDNDQPFGMIVINAAYETILHTILDGLDTNKDIYLVNEQGDLIRYNASESEHEFHFRSSNLKRELYPFVDDALSSRKKKEAFYFWQQGEEYIAYFSRRNLIPYDNHKLAMMTIMTVPKRDFLGPVHEMQRKALLLTSGLVLAACLCGAMFAFYQTRPLKKMTQEIKAYKDGRDAINLPVHLLDEVGDMARAFDDLAKNLNESRQAERKIMGKWQAIMDNTVDGIIAIDDKGIIRNYNKACETIFGYKKEETIGQNVKMLMPAPYRKEHDGYLRSYHETGHKKIIGIGRAVEGQRKDGSVFPLDLSVAEVTVGEEKLYSGILRDITERKKAEEEIWRSNEELERFAYVASHDLQEPLRMVSNFTALLDEEYGKDMDEQAGQYMTFIVDASKRMQELVSDLLEYSRVGYEDAGFADFDSFDQLSGALNNLDEIVRATGARITHDEMPLIYANPVRFSRLLQNLVGNAIKYRDDKTPEIHIGVQDRGNDWLFSVRDNGIGIKDEYLEQIFIIFKRLHNKNEYSGTGIGLAVCKKIVDSFGGEIWAESELEKGSVFYFTIPRPEKKRRAA